MYLPVGDQAKADSTREFAATTGESASDLEAAWLIDWLRLKVSPFWASTGVDFRRGGFFEAIAWDGRPIDALQEAGP